MRAISLPFRLDGYGRIATTSDTARIWADRARSVVSTQPGERVMRPTFGCSLPEDVLSAMDATPALVEAQVQDSFATWLPELTFTGLDVVEMSEADGEISVNVTYEVPTVQQDTPASYSFII